MTKKSTQSTSKKRVSKKKASAEESTPKASADSTSVARDSQDLEKKSAAIAFSMDDIEALVASRGSSKTTEAKKKPAKSKPVANKKKAQAEDAPAEKRVLGAASLTDILGFNPTEKKASLDLDEDAVPKKWKKYYKLLIDLRNHLSDEIDLHTSDTLQHNADDHQGDRTLEHDAGTDSFDREFLLSLVSSEQDALNEIEEALLRIKQGTYGVCEETGKPIAKDRLTAVPFARYSLEGQVEFEKKMQRKVDRSAGGLFTDSEDAPKIASDDDDDE